MEMESKIYEMVKNNDQEIITFIDDLPGFKNKKEFLFLSSEEKWPFVIMQSVEEKKLAFITINPWEILVDYKFKISDSIKERLKIKSTEDILVLSICTVRNKLKNMTVNLAAPVVINYKKGLGKQVVLGATDYKVRHPVFSARSRLGGLKSACFEQKRG